MLQVHTSWKRLFSHIVSIEVRDTPRKPNGSSLIVKVNKTRYDPKIPVLDENSLNLWFSGRGLNPNVPVNQNAPNGTNGHTDSICSSSSSTKRQREPEIPKLKLKNRCVVRFKKRPRRTPPRIIESAESESSDEEIKTREQRQQSKATIEESSISSTSDSDDYQKTETICQGDIDGLAIKENYDEYSQYDDEDDEEIIETEFSRNLKKIKPDLPPKPSIVTINSAPVRNLAREKSSEPQLEPGPSKPKIPEPDWPAVSELIKKNQLNTALRDLCFFKLRIKADDIAKKLPKELILKCFAEDDTMTLNSILDLIYELDLECDVDFWSELVKRFKRKLNPCIQIKKFRSLMNPEAVHSNYKRSMVNLSDYAHKRNLTFQLSVNEIKFLMDPIGSTMLKTEAAEGAEAQTRIKTNNSSRASQPNSNAHGFVAMDIKPTDTKQEISTNDQENNGDSLQEQVNGNFKIKKERRITPSKKKTFGKPVYKVSRPKKEIVQNRSFSKRL